MCVLSAGAGKLAGFTVGGGIELEVQFEFIFV